MQATPSKWKPLKLMTDAANLYPRTLKKDSILKPLRKTDDAMLPISILEPLRLDDLSLKNKEWNRQFRFWNPKIDDRNITLKNDWMIRGRQVKIEGVSIFTITMKWIQLKLEGVFYK